jgi:hypothetical protein
MSDVERLAVLLELVRKLPPPTEFERQEQALAFAYGNLAASTNHKPTREGFRKLARERYGWTDEQFDAFANARSGWAP